MHAARALFCLTLLFGLTTPNVRPEGAAAPGNWPGWRGPLRDGISTETGLLTSWPADGPPKLWTATGLGAGFSSVAVAGGRIFTMGDRRDGQYVIGLEEATGKWLWGTRVGAPHHDPELGGSRSTPATDGDLVWTIGTDGDLVCVEAATGRERWRRNLERDFGGRMMSSWMYSESPLLDGDRIVVTPGGPRAAIVALDKTTGKDIWRTTGVPRLGSAGSDGAGYSSIVISNGAGVKQYVQLMGRGVVSVRASDGAFLWGYNRIANNVANIPTPVVKDNYVFTSTGYSDGGSALLELASASGGGVTARERYYFDAGTLQNHHGGFVLIDGYIYGGHGHNNGFPFALELSTGKNTWGRVRGAGTGSAAVTAAEGLLYFRYQNGVMALIEANPAQYTLKSSFQIPGVSHPSWSHPVVTGGRLYLREQDALHVYNIKR